jgi:hypothetical protein
VLLQRVVYLAFFLAGFFVAAVLLPAWRPRLIVFFVLAAAFFATGFSARRLVRRDRFADPADTSAGRRPFRFATGLL